MKNKKVLITGVIGFIGYHLVEPLYVECDALVDNNYMDKLFLSHYYKR